MALIEFLLPDMLHSTMTDQYEHTLREDVIRLGVTAVITILFLAAITALQARTGFMNQLIVLPQESVDEPTAPAVAEDTATPAASPTAQPE